jgi:endo-alpha-1,4-polygalactosaminidase (GH114 family)
MGSKLISSIIAWYSRYEIIHETFEKIVTKEEQERIADQLVHQQALNFFAEDAKKTVYRTDSETMGKRLLDLGIFIDYVLTHSIAKNKFLLERVFSEKSDDGVVPYVTREQSQLRACRTQTIQI